MYAGMYTRRLYIYRVDATGKGKGGGSDGDAEGALLRSREIRVARPGR